MDTPVQRHTMVTRKINGQWQILYGNNLPPPEYPGEELIIPVVQLEDRIIRVGVDGPMTLVPDSLAATTREEIPDVDEALEAYQARQESSN